MRKGLLAANAASVIRALRFGATDAKVRLLRAYEEIDPFGPRPENGLSESPVEKSLLTQEAALWDEGTEWDETVALSPETAGPLSYNKVCNLRDFRHPEFLKWIREVYPHEIRRFGPQFPIGVEDRRQWEIAMTVRTLAEHGALHDKSRILGVGVGNEPTIFYLTNHVAQVFATDLYIQGDDGWAEADRSMLTDPGVNSPYAWNPRRLVTQHMDGTNLRYEDESFDGIFSSGSIEHFGTLDDIERSIDEMYRVLKPGGVLALTTEFRIEGPGFGSVGLMFFTPELIHERLIGSRQWSLLSPYDFSISEETRQTEFSQPEAVEVFMAHIKSHRRFLYHEYKAAKYPMIVMRDDPYVWTSVSLALRKSG